MVNLFHSTSSLFLSIPAYFIVLHSPSDIKHSRQRPEPSNLCDGVEQHPIQIGA